MRLMWAINGAVVAGNVDIGLYDEGGRALFTNGPVAQVGINAPQSFAVSPVVNIVAGLYYIALWESSTTATFFRGSSLLVDQTTIIGHATQDGLVAGLPANITRAVPATAHIPVFGISSRSTI